MDKPKCAVALPAKVELQPGTYFWCACGLSANQPFCDGSHAGTPFTPTKIELTQPKRLSLCQCKQTLSPPYCDGTHAELEEEE